MRKLFIFLLFGMSASVSLGRDLGVESRVYEILEKDLRVVLLESAARVNWKVFEDDLKSQAKKFLDSLPARTLPSPPATATRWADPSIELASDIKVPVLDPATGEYRWSVAVAKGTRVNPLETMPLTQALLFFNGNSEEQVAFVAEVLRKYPLAVMPVETSGNPARHSGILKQPVFYAQDTHLARFAIAHTPTLLYQGTGNRRLFVGVTSFARPYRLSELEQAWQPPASLAAEGTGAER